MIPFPTQAEKDAFMVQIKAHAVATALDHVAPAPTHGAPRHLLHLAQQLSCEVAFYQAIRPTADLTEAALDRWFLWLLAEELREYTTSAPAAELFRRRLSGDTPNLGDVDAAAAEAEFAAIRAAESAMPEALSVAVSACCHDIATTISDALTFTSRDRMADALLQIVSTA